MRDNFKSSSLKLIIVCNYLRSAEGSAKKDTKAGFKSKNINGYNQPDLLRKATVAI